MIELPVDKIKLAWFNPREARDPEVIRALEESARRSGILDPIHVVRIGDEYLCIEGGARLLVAQNLGLEKIPARIHDVDVEDAMKLTGELQLTKDDLTPAEKGKFIAMLVKRGIFKSVDDAAKYYDISHDTVYSWIREYKAKTIIDEVALPKPVAKEIASLPRELRKPIIQEVKDIPSADVQKRIVKEVKREIKEKMVEEPEEVREIVRKVMERGGGARELDVKGREFDYHIFESDQKVVIMQLGERKTLVGQIAIPTKDLDMLLRHLQKFVE